MAKSLGRSPAFRGEVDKIATAVGKQGENFKSQFAALTKVDNVWRDHVTTMRKAGAVTTGQAKKMYAAYGHLGLSVKELQARIKASNGELVNSATYNKAAREELTRHTKAMTLLGKKEEVLAKATGKSVAAIQKETEASMKRTKSFDAVTAGIDKQIAAYKDMDKHQAKVVRGEQALAKATGARVGKIKEITTRMRAQGISYEDIGKRLDSLRAKHAKNTTQMGRVAKASDSLRKSNKALAGEIDALGRIRLKNLAATQATVRSLEGLARKYPQLGKQVAVLSQKVAAGNMPLATADKLLHKLRSSMSQTTTKASLLSRAMSSLVSHLKSFASYAAAATIISGIAATFGYAVSAVIKFDQALHDLQAITQATDREVGLMGEKIREVGRTTKFSAIEVAAAMRTLAYFGPSWIYCC
jgi:chromosome segregation ATPase